MTKLLACLTLLAAAPLAAQQGADSIRAAALRESPPRDTLRHEVTSVVLRGRGDTADVTVSLERGDTVERQHRLTLVRDGERWVALPKRSIVLLHGPARKP